jgi:hypothetical protein
MPVPFRSSPISSHTNASWRGLDRNSSNNTILKAANPSCTPIQVSAIPLGFNECFSHPNKDPTYTQFPRHFFTGALSCLGSSCRDTTSEGTPRLLAACNFLKALIQSKPPAPQDINSMSYVIMTVNMQLGVPSDSRHRENLQDSRNTTSTFRFSWATATSFHYSFLFRPFSKSIGICEYPSGTATPEYPRDLGSC